MKLYTFPSSPFGSKVLAVAHLCHINHDLEIVEYHPFVRCEEFRKINPLKKIPVLHIRDDTVLHDSSVICAYLMQEYNLQRVLMPDYIEARQQEETSNSLMLAGVLYRYETIFRSKELRSHVWALRQQNAITYTLLALSKNPSMELTYGNICLWIALYYLNFRLGNHEWIQTPLTPHLTWLSDFSYAHPFLKNIAPKDATPPADLDTLCA